MYIRELVGYALVAGLLVKLFQYLLPDNLTVVLVTISHCPQHKEEKLCMVGFVSVYMCFGWCNIMLLYNTYKW